MKTSTLLRELGCRYALYAAIGDKSMCNVIRKLGADLAARSSNLERWETLLEKIDKNPRKATPMCFSDKEG